MSDSQTPDEIPDEVVEWAEEHGFDPVRVARVRGDI